MGVNHLSTIIKNHASEALQNKPLSAYSGSRFAIDALQYVFFFARRHPNNPNAVQEGFEAILAACAVLSITPIFVFDDPAYLTRTKTRVLCDRRTERNRKKDMLQFEKERLPYTQAYEAILSVMADLSFSEVHYVCTGLPMDTLIAQTLLGKRMLAIAPDVDESNVELQQMKLKLAEIFGYTLDAIKKYKLKDGLQKQIRKEWLHLADLLKSKTRRNVSKIEGCPGETVSAAALSSKESSQQGKTEKPFSARREEKIVSLERTQVNATRTIGGLKTYLYGRKACVMSANSSEAEGLCVKLVESGYADFVVTNDVDACVYLGARSILQKAFMQPLVLELDCVKMLDLLNLTWDQFVELSALLGTDHCVGVNGVAGGNGLELMRKYGSADAILEGEGSLVIPDGFAVSSAKSVYSNAGINVNSFVAWPGLIPQKAS